MPLVRLLGQAWYYQAWGNPQSSPLVLLHGFTGSHASWGALAPSWAERHFVIAPDLPGHGSTPAPLNPPDLSLESVSVRLGALLDHLSLPKSAMLGYSMGGRHALQFALKNPQRLTTLILESASWGISDEEERSERQVRDRELAQTIESRGLDWFVSHWANLPLFEAQSQAVRDQENQVRLANTAFGLAQSLRGAGSGEQRSLLDQLRELNIPTLIVTGALDRKFCSIAEQMALEMPNASWVPVTASGHTVHAEQPLRFRNLVTNFLKHGEPDHE